MLTLRRAQERGHANHGWLDTYHTFSFADYFDPKNMGFSVLRVINEDVVAPAQGFGTHPHRDMEIITLVLSGALEHKDSMGNVAQILPGEVQCMSAGTGITHSEYNPSTDTPLHLLQIWIETNEPGIAPGYEQKNFPPAERRGRFQRVVSPDGRDGSCRIHQNASLFLASLAKGDKPTYDLASGRRAFVHVASGTATLNGQPLGAGDGVRVEGETTLVFETTTDSEVLLFDLP
jgi:redox-sensitive bicupin YhaK (pirin superfamily)